MTIFTEFNPTALRAGDCPMLSRPVTLAMGANAAPVNGIATPLPRGSILGLITSSGKMTLSALAATDGSQVPVAVLAADTDASLADQVCPAYYMGEFADLMCTFGAGHTQATVDTAFANAGKPMFIRKVGAYA